MNEHKMKQMILAESWARSPPIIFNFIGLSIKVLQYSVGCPFLGLALLTVETLDQPLNIQVFRKLIQN